MRILWGVLFIVVRTLTLGVVIYTMALPLSLIVGWPWWFSLLVAAGVTGVYCFLGGLTGVMITDVLQFIIMIVCAVGLIVFSLRKVGGWAGGLLTGAIIIVGSRFTTPYSQDKLKGLCWGTVEEEPEETPRLLLDWRLWSVVSLVVGVSLTLLFWLVF